MRVLEAPDTSDEVRESRPMRGIADVVVGCSRCICPSDSSKKLAPTCSLTLGAQENAARESI